MESRSKSFQSVYSVDLTNQNYIAALAKYNKNVSAIKINDIAIDKKSQFKLENLPTVLANLPSQSEPIKLEFINAELQIPQVSSVKIHCSSMNSTSTADIFPDVAILQYEMTDYRPSEEDLAQTTKANPLVNSYILAYFNHDGSDLGIVPPNLPILNAIQAFMTVRELQYSLVSSDIPRLSGALHLPDKNMIIFQHNETNYILRYGNPTTIEQCILTLDLDDGFCNKEAPAHAELQQFFTDWKAKNYEGDMIPNQAGFDIKEALEQSKRQDSEVRQTLILQSIKQQTSKKRQEDNAELYHHQHAERKKRNARIGLLGILAGISIATVIFFPLAIWFIKLIRADIKANKDADANQDKIFKISRTKAEDQEIRDNRKQFKRKAFEAKILDSLPAKPVKVVPDRVVKYVTASKKARDEMFENRVAEPINRVITTSFNLFNNYKQSSKQEDRAVADSVAKIRRR